MSRSRYVKFDRSGVPYVEYDDLRKQKEVQEQLQAARRVLGRRHKSAVVSKHRRRPVK